MVESFLAINPSFTVVGYGGLGKIQGFVVVLIVEFNHGVTNFFCDGGWLIINIVLWKLRG